MNEYAARILQANLEVVIASDPNAPYVDITELLCRVLDRIGWVKDFSDLEAKVEAMCKDFHPEAYEQMLAPRWVGPWIGKKR